MYLRVWDWPVRFCCPHPGLWRVFPHAVYSARWMILGNDWILFSYVNVLCIFVCVHMCVCVYLGCESMFMEAHVCAGAHGSQETVSQWSLWGLQTQVSH